MNAAELLAQLDALGVEVVADGERVRVSAVRGQLSDDIKAAIGTHKDELRRLVATRARPRADGLVRIPRGEPLPLSSFQERLWVLQLLEPESTAHNIVSAWPLEGASADADRLAAAAAAVLRRHEILHSTFVEHDGRPVLQVLDPRTVSVPVHDLRNHPEDARQSVMEAAARQAAHAPIDLRTQAAARAAVYRLGDDRVLLLLAAHHIAMDAWSLDVFRRELFAAYHSGPQALVAEPELQYADYAAWQRRIEASPALAAQVEWWVKALADAPQLSVFPADHTTEEGAAGAVRPFAWDAALSEGVRGLARAEGATVYMVLLAACAAVLHGHTGQADVVLGSPTGERERPELETMIGPFVNLLVIRIPLHGDPSFAELLRRTRDAVLDAHDHRHVPFEKLVERLKPVRSFTHSPLFQVAVVQHNATTTPSKAVMGGGALHELTWFVREETDGRLVGSFEYRSDLYEADTIDAVAGHLENFVRAVVADRQRAIGQVSLLGPEERETVLQRFNATRVDLDLAVFPAQFARQAAATPDRAAVSFEGRTLTYAELEREANRLARHLRALGIGPGRLVGLCAERSLHLVVALLGIQKSGGAYVPLDPGFPAERLAYMLADSGAAVLVTAGGSLDFEVPAGVRVVDLHTEQETLAALDGRSLENLAGPHDPAYVIYTSGSTGRPKGVAVPHGALANFLGSMKTAPGLGEADVLAAVTTISFDIAGLELYLPLLVGARVFLLSRETAADGLLLAAELARDGATVMQATPATWRLLLEARWPGGPSFRALCGGEPLPPDLADALLERVGELWNLYGPTETTIWSTLDRVERGGPITVGRPIANTEIYVLSRAGVPVPVGVPGEILIGGDGVALGYHQRPELTAEKFVDDPFSGRAGARLYRTGDLGRWRRDGRLEHLGRMDHQVKVRGFRIELGEIEATLAAHPAVRQAVVIAREAAAGDLRLVAYVVYEPGEDLTVSEVRRHLRRALPDYMVPSVVVALDAIPLTPNGKVDRSALPDPFKNAMQAASHEPPAPGMEQRLADIWREVLHVERVGAEDNFFELGGHSLLTLRVAAAVEKLTGCRMDPRTLFFQNLRQVAATLAAHAARDDVARSV